jgi:hypothetical protein
LPARFFFSTGRFFFEASATLFRFTARRRRIMLIILKYLKIEVLGVVPKFEVQCEVNNNKKNPVSVSVQKVLFFYGYFSGH